MNDQYVGFVNKAGHVSRYASLSAIISEIKEIRTIVKELEEEKAEEGDVK